MLDDLHLDELDVAEEEEEEKDHFEAASGKAAEGIADGVAEGVADGGGGTGMAGF